MAAVAELGSLGRMKASSSLAVMITSAVPVIAVSDSARAEDYYCRVLGFQKMFAYPPEASKPDPRYLARGRSGWGGAASSVLQAGARGNDRRISLGGRRGFTT